MRVGTEGQEAYLSHPRPQSCLSLDEPQMCRAGAESPALCCFLDRGAQWWQSMGSVPAGIKTVKLGSAGSRHFVFLTHGFPFTQSLHSMSSPEARSQGAQHPSNSRNIQTGRQEDRSLSASGDAGLLRTTATEPRKRSTPKLCWPLPPVSLAPKQLHQGQHPGPQRCLVHSFPIPVPHSHCFLKDAFKALPIQRLGKLEFTFKRSSLSVYFPKHFLFAVL